MLRTVLFVLLSATALVADAAKPQKFTLSGRIDKLQTGDTLRFERVVLPDWNTEPAFDIVVKRSGSFDFKGEQEHDQFYRMTYLPREGRAKVCARDSKMLIVGNGDQVTMTGTADDIYYCTLGGGIYKDRLLSQALILEDSLGRIRGHHLRLSQEAFERGDSVAAMAQQKQFNLFYQNNAEGLDRVKAAEKAYSDANPHGSFYLVVELMKRISYTPLKETKEQYAQLSPELQDSYYGRMIVNQIAALEHLEPGQPAPDFSLVTTDGKTVRRDDFKGRYLLIYHWGMCPGSIYIDEQVRALYDKYAGKGLSVLGVTESIESIRRVYEALHKDQKVEGPGVGDIRPVLANMLEHKWIEVEVETDKPENKAIMKEFGISGWPYFILIDPNGKMLTRNYSNAFYESRNILDKQMGEAVKAE